MPTPIQTLFYRKSFYRAERTRLNKAWRNLIRDVVLIYSSSPTESLRSMVRQQAILEPLHRINVSRIEPATEPDPDYAHRSTPVYRNLARLGFGGDGCLFKATSLGRLPFLRAAVVDAGSAALVYYSESNSARTTRERAELELPEIQYVAERQLPYVDAHNRWVDKALDRVFDWYAEHIKLWREEAHLDRAKARSA